MHDSAHCGDVDQLGSDGICAMVFFPNKDALHVTWALAKYSRAQLIIAENDANTGDFLVHLHDHHFAANGQPAFSLASDQSRGHGRDRRRAVPPGRISADSTATGADHWSSIPDGGMYGSQSCFPLPDVERINNPNDEVDKNADSESDVRRSRTSRPARVRLAGLEVCLPTSNVNVQPLTPLAYTGTLQVCVQKVRLGVSTSQ